MLLYQMKEKKKHDERKGEREGMDNLRSYEGKMKVRDGEEAGERDGVSDEGRS